MGLETATYINGLVVTNPLDSDPKSQGAGQFRLVKSTIKNTFPNVTGAVTPTHVEINYLSGVTSSVQVQLNTKAPTASPVFTTAATLPAATTIGTVTAAEILTLSGVSSAIQTQLNGKGAITGQTWSGAHDFSGGSISVPTASAGDSSTKAASTAFVAAAAFSAVLPGQSGNAGKLVTTDGSSASWTALKTINGSSLVGAGALVLGPRNYTVAQYTASSTFVVPADTYVIRSYAFGAGAAGTTTNSGGGGGCAYGDIAVTPGDNVTLTISAGVAKVTLSGVDLLTANPASGTTAGAASKHGSVTNGGAYSGGAGVANGGGASSGSPLGAGVNGVASVGGSGWGGAGTAQGGGGVGGPGTSKRGGDGLSVPSTDPLLDGLTARGGNTGATGASGGSGGPGGGGGSADDGGAGGFGGGGGRSSGASGSNFGGDGGFGGGGGWANSGAGGAGGFGGGGGRGGGGGGAGGAAVIRIYY